MSSIEKAGHVPAESMVTFAGIRNNLNQLAHCANMGELRMNASTLSQIEESYEHIQKMRKALIKAIGLIESS